MTNTNSDDREARQLAKFREQCDRENGSRLDFNPRTIDAVLGGASRGARMLVHVKSFSAFTDGSGAPAVIECTGYTYAFDYLGVIKCNLIGSPVVGSRMASEGAHRRAFDAYKTLVCALLTKSWFSVNSVMYPEAIG